MRFFSLRSVRLARVLVVTASLALPLAACGGGSSSSGNSPIPNPGSNQLCDTNSQGTQLARPSQGQTGVSSGTTSIEIVSNGNGDQLFSSYGQFDIILRDNFGNQFSTGFLNITSDSSGPHPYNSDFYYVGSIPSGSLLGGDTYSAYLNAPNTNCTPGFLGSFST